MDYTVLVLAIWCIIQVFIALWGLELINNNCQDYTLYSRTRVLLVISAVFATIFFCSLMCNHYCYEDINDETSIWVPIFTIAAATTIITMESMIHSDIDDCATNTDNFKLTLMYAGIVTSIIPLIYGLYTLGKSILTQRERRREKERAKTATRSLAEETRRAKEQEEADKVRKETEAREEKARELVRQREEKEEARRQEDLRKAKERSDQARKAQEERERKERQRIQQEQEERLVRQEEERVSRMSPEQIEKEATRAQNLKRRNEIEQEVETLKKQLSRTDVAERGDLAKQLKDLQDEYMELGTGQSTGKGRRSGGFRRELGGFRGFGRYD